MDKAKILIIDDEKDFLEMLRESLELNEYLVETALNGKEGIKKAKEFKPNLVISDVRMPKKDGFEVLKTLKEDSEFRAPVIMLTAVDDFEKIKEAYDDEADFYATKPVHLESLLNNIRVLLNISKDKI